jgi:hypothetical protein
MKRQDRRKHGAKKDHMDSESDGASDPMDDSAFEFNPEELREFVAADFVEVKADPAFREGLRKKLWTLVQDRYGRGPTRKN